MLARRLAPPYAVQLQLSALCYTADILQLGQRGLQLLRKALSLHPTQLSLIFQFFSQIISIIIL